MSRPIDLGRGASTTEDDIERMLAAAFAKPKPLVEPPSEEVVDLINRIYNNSK